MGKPKAVCAGDRSLRQFIFLSPVFVTIIFCFWAAYDDVVPLSANFWKDCSPESEDAACIDAQRQLRLIKGRRGEGDGARAHVQHIFTYIAHGRESELQEQPDMPNLKVEETHKIVPLMPFLSITAVESTSDGNNGQELPLPQNGSTIAALTELLKEATVSTFEHPQPSGPAQDEGMIRAVEEVERIMRDLRRSARQNESEKGAPLINRRMDSDCEGKRVFIYHLPTKFNADLLHRCLELLPWQNMCDFLSNSGMGRLLDTRSTDGDAAQVLVPSGLWYETHQYALEVLFHKRLMHYKCLTTSTELADMFYIPYYGGLDVLRWHFAHNSTAAQIDELGLELIRWLQEQPTWRRKQGLDHVLVLGKITWDFRREPTGYKWGSSLLLQEEMQNLTRLLIERQPWHEHEVGVPHPTFFHPRHDKDIRAWQRHIDSEKRTHLVSFAGQPRPQQPESIRSQLIRQCTRSGSTDRDGVSACRFMDCARDKCLLPNTTMELFMHSEFCMQPPGDSPTRRSIFDSLIAGCIPVLFDPYSAYYQYPWHLPEDPKAYSVYIPADDVREGRVDVIEELSKIPESVRQEMRRRIIYEVMPGLVYARPDARLKEVDDAFVVSLRGLFARISQRVQRGR